MTEKRLIALVVFFTAFAFMIELNMVHINVSGKYSEKAENQQSRRYDIDDSRGMITDINFNPITNSTEKYKTLVTAYDQDLQQVFNALTETEKRRFYSNIQNKANFMAQLDHPVKNRVVYKISNRYSDFNIAQHLVGYVDGDGNGVSGMELVFDEELKNAAEVRYIDAKINGYGQIVSSQIKTETENMFGVPALLRLTLDSTIQRMCEGLAKEYIPNGAIVVMESKTGRIKAMVSTPFYSANNVAHALGAENSPLVNKALQSYEAGSVIKPLWSAVLLENDYSADRIYNCTGTIEVNGHEYHCANNKAHGEVDMEQALVVSCNCYFINADIKNKAFSFYQMAKNLSFGESIVMTRDYGTKSGYFPQVEELNDLGQLSSISFGQGKMLLTPIHVVAYMNMFANGGIYVYPQIAEEICNADTRQRIINLYNLRQQRLVDESIAAKVKSMLKSVVEEGAKGRAKPAELSAGGKTGTAQTGRYNENGEEILTAWFCGFYPYENPEYTICITMYNGGESTRTAAPLFKKICDSLYYVMENKSQ